MQTQEKVREASHAGSWYTDNSNELNNQLTQFLNNVKSEFKITDKQKIKAVIGPHAGLHYSGPTAAYGYSYLQPQDNLRVFLLGPCHHQYLQGCGLSTLEQYQTPLGNIKIDTQTIKQLREKGNFIMTTKDVEEEEHSLEMHLSFIQKMLGSKPFTLVPIMVGQTDYNIEKYYGTILAPFFEDPNTIFCISSDFCHWGSRFQYQYYKEKDGEIWQSIEKLDRDGMNHIESQNSINFTKYLEDTENTICGRHPIGILLHIIENCKLKDKLQTKFVGYAQSSHCMTKKDSSVSYASSITFLNL